MHGHWYVYCYSVLFILSLYIEQGIDGDAFTQLPSDRTQLREEFQLTFGGAIKIVKLLSEVQTNKPGMYVYVQVEKTLEMKKME